MAQVEVQVQPHLEVLGAARGHFVVAPPGSPVQEEGEEKEKKEKEGEKEDGEDEEMRRKGKDLCRRRACRPPTCPLGCAGYRTRIPAGAGGTRIRKGHKIMHHLTLQFCNQPPLPQGEVGGWLFPGNDRSSPHVGGVRLGRRLGRKTTF